MGPRALGALAVGAGLLVVGAVLAVGAVRDAGPEMSDTDELAEAIGDIQSYDCESRTDVGDTIDFEGGIARQRFCTLTENGEAVFGDDASAIELVVVTPPEAMDEFVAHNRRTTRSTIPAIVGENWFIPGLGGEDAEPVRRDFLGGLEGAREGEYGVFRRR
jgi:hypothetical protein